MPDQVQLLVGVDPQLGSHRRLRLLKGRSSRLLRQELPSLQSRLPTLWTNSYFVATVGGAPLAVVKHHIENQKNVCTHALLRLRVALARGLGAGQAAGGETGGGTAGV